MDEVFRVGQEATAECQCVVKLAEADEVLLTQAEALAEEAMSLG